MHWLRFFSSSFIMCTKLKKKKQGSQQGGHTLHQPRGVPTVRMLTTSIRQALARTAAKLSTKRYSHSKCAGGLLTGKRANRRISLQEVVTRFSVEFFNL